MRVVFTYKDSEGVRKMFHVDAPDMATHYVFIDDHDIEWYYRVYGRWMSWYSGLESWISVRDYENLPYPPHRIQSINQLS